MWTTSIAIAEQPANAYNNKVELKDTASGLPKSA